MPVIESIAAIAAAVTGHFNAFFGGVGLSISLVATTLAASSGTDPHGSNLIFLLAAAAGGLVSVAAIIRAITRGVQSIIDFIGDKIEHSIEVKADEAVKELVGDAVRTQLEAQLGPPEDGKSLHSLARENHQTLEHLVDAIGPLDDIKERREAYARNVDLLQRMADQRRTDPDHELRDEA